MEGHRAKLDQHAIKICHLLLGPLPSQARLVNCLDDVVGQLREELAGRREAEAELEALRSWVVQVWDLVLGNVDRSSLLATSMCMVGERLEGWIDAAATNGLCWGSRSALVAIVLHFPKLYVDLEELGSGCNAGLAEDEVYALWSWVHVAIDSLV
jgi:hypothetical protein